VASNLRPAFFQNAQTAHPTSTFYSASLYITLHHSASLYITLHHFALHEAGNARHLLGLHEAGNNRHFFFWGLVVVVVVILPEISMVGQT